MSEVKFKVKSSKMLFNLMSYIIQLFKMVTISTILVLLAVHRDIFVNVSFSLHVSSKSVDIFKMYLIQMIIKTGQIFYFTMKFGETH